MQKLSFGQGRDSTSPKASASAITNTVGHRRKIGKNEKKVHAKEGKQK